MLARVIDWSIENRFLVCILTGALALAGVWSMSRTPLDAIPDLSDVQVIVHADWPGQDPETIEDHVVHVLEPHDLAGPRCALARARRRDQQHAVAGDRLRERREHVARLGGREVQVVEQQDRGTLGGERAERVDEARAERLRRERLDPLRRRVTAQHGVEAGCEPPAGDRASPPYAR